MQAGILNCEMLFAVSVQEGTKLHLAVSVQEGIKNLWDGSVQEGIKWHFVKKYVLVVHIAKLFFLLSVVMRNKL